MVYFDWFTRMKGSIYKRNRIISVTGRGQVKAVYMCRCVTNPSQVGAAADKCQSSLDAGSRLQSIFTRISQGKQLMK